ncbi:MAG: DMT family transporter [Thermoplasmata archaeon]
MTHHTGYVSALSSAILFGLLASLSKIALRDLHPLIIAGMIYLIAGLALSPRSMKRRMERKDLGIVLLVAISGVVLAPILYIWGLSISTAVNASLLGNTEVLFTVLIAFVFLGERAQRRDYLAMLLLVIGAFVITTNLEFRGITLAEMVVGNVLIILGCLFWGIDNNLSKILSERNDILQLVSLKGLIGGSAVLTFSVVMRVPFNITVDVVPYLVGIGLLSIAASVSLFLYALRQIGAMKTGVIFSTSSLFGALFAFLILSESVSVLQLGAGLLMILAVYLLCRGARPEADEVQR